MLHIRPWLLALILLTTALLALACSCWQVWHGVPPRLPKRLRRLRVGCGKPKSGGLPVIIMQDAAEYIAAVD
jgi:hypothetical protein